MLFGLKSKSESQLLQRLLRLSTLLCAAQCVCGGHASAQSVWLNLGPAYVVPGNWSTVVPPVLPGQTAIFAPNILPGNIIDLTGVIGTISPSSWTFQTGTRNWSVNSGVCAGCAVQTNIIYQGGGGNTVSMNVPLVGTSSVGLSVGGTARASRRGIGSEPGAVP